MDWLVSKVTLAACVALIIALTGLTGYLGVQSYTLANEKAALTTKVANAAAETERLRIEKGALALSVLSLKNEIDLAKTTQAELEDAINGLLNINKEAGDKLKEIENAPASDDGPVAPVLRRTFDGLQRPVRAK